MYLSHDHDDHRIEQRAQVRRRVGELVADLQHDVSPRIIISALVGAAKALHARLERGDPIVHRPRRGVAS